MDDRNTTLQSKNLKLVFEALPKNLFVDKEYQVYLNYVDEQDNFVINTASIMVKLELIQGGDSMTILEDILTVIPFNPHPIAKSGRTAISVSLSRLTQDYSHRPFILRATLIQTGISALSSPFNVVNYLLCVTRHEFPHPVYNDNRGDKFLDLPVTLLDRNGDTITNRTVPLLVTLHYTTGELVHPAHRDKPTVIQLDNDAPTLRAGENTTIVRVRIMQISRNHMNNNFVLRISPDTTREPVNSDVGFVECGPFEVRTKLVEIPNDKSDAAPRGRKRQLCSIKLEARGSTTTQQARSYAKNWSTDDSAETDYLIKKLDDHIAKLRKMMWRSSGTTTMLDVNGNIVQLEQEYYHPPNPNAYIAQFISEYENDLRPCLRSIASNNSHEASTVKVLSSLATGKKEIVAAVEQKVDNIKYMLKTNIAIGPMGNASIGLPALDQSMELLGFFDVNKYAFVPLCKLSDTVQRMAKVAVKSSELNHTALLCARNGGDVLDFVMNTACEWDSNRHEIILE